ncbi:MAG: alpha/beta hydrolase, partial [Chloroflexota bacterium]
MEQFLNNKGTELWSIKQGDGIPLILCNGGPGCDDYLEPVSRMIEDQCIVVRFEQRGCGRSDWDNQYDLDTTVHDIDFVRQAYGFEKVIIAGHSAGVEFCLSKAQRLPQGVLGLIGLAGGRL